MDDKAKEAYLAIGSDICNEKDFMRIWQAALAHRDAQQWLPIESAPKDGTSIFVAGGTVEWRIDSYAPTNSTGHIGGWFSHSAQRYLQWQPTHWQPLPTPRRNQHAGAAIHEG